MAKKVLLVLVLATLTVRGGFALDIIVTPPTGTSIDSDLNAASQKLKDQLQKEFGSIDTKPEEFITSWGNASVFGSHGATARAYGEYKLFSFTVGSNVGLQLPGSPFTIMDDLDDLTGKLNDDHDIKLGLSPQIINIRAGVNTSKFLLKDLYLGLHVGFIDLKGDDLGLEGFSFKSFSIGVTGNYQLVPSKSLAKGLLLWRGVNIGTGILYSGTQIGYSMNLDKFEEPLDSNYGGGTLRVEPKMFLDFKVDTVTVPLEAFTAVKLLWFLNIPLGLGVDLGFGKSDLKIGMDGNVYVDGNTYANSYKTTPGKISVSAGGDMPPSVFNLKLMTGVGINVGPVVLDIPVTFYLDNGFSVGLTFGVVW